MQSITEVAAQEWTYLTLEEDTCWMNGRMNEWMYGWMNEQTDRCVD